MRAAFDIPALSERIKAIIKTYNPNNNNNNNNSRNTRSNRSSNNGNNNSSNGNNNSNNNSNNGNNGNNNNNNNADYDDGENILRGLVGSLIINIMAAEKSYWGRAGIRMVSASDFERCYSKNNAKVLGRGAFGKFMSVTADSCIRGIPPGVKNVGVKTEYIKNYYHPNQSPEAVIDAFRLAKRAAKLGVGPDIYDVFVTQDSRDKVMIVKVSQIIYGKTWQDTEWDSPEQKHAAAEALKLLIQKLNEAGIIHHDLHGGNVMVEKSGRVYIIDYDLAKFVKNEEYSKMHNFNESYPDEYEGVGVASQKGIRYVYDKLIEEGTIKETQSGGKKTRKARK